MKKIAYACTHCGHRFESELTDGLECPKCFWSTSVRPAGESTDPLERLRQQSIPKRPNAIAKLQAVLPKIMIVLSLGLLAVAAVIFGPRVAPKMSGPINFVSEKIKIPLRRVKVPSIKLKGDQIPETPSVPPAGQLTEQDNEILKRRVSMSLPRTLTPQEKKILETQTTFKTGLIEKLPSQIWTLEQFVQMLNEQEKAYRVPLPRSYRKKLEKHFKGTYLLSQVPFENSRLLEARDYWVKALAFPRYSDDLRKHRGVALTMLRPFTNDTLAKISVANHQLVERDVREQEKQINDSYQGIATLVQASSWEQALVRLSLVRRQIEQFQSPQAEQRRAPAYPPEAGQVDEDIRQTLVHLLEIPAPAIADLFSLHADLNAKTKIIRSMLPEFIQKNQERYDQALSGIEQKEWPAAKEKLKEIESPSPLAEDAAEKIKILEKIK
jgi:hypothetical protein